MSFIYSIKQFNARLTMINFSLIFVPLREENRKHATPVL